MITFCTYCGKETNNTGLITSFVFNGRFQISIFACSKKCKNEIISEAYQETLTNKLAGYIYSILKAEQAHLN